MVECTNIIQNVSILHKSEGRKHINSADKKEEGRTFPGQVLDRSGQVWTGLARSGQAWTDPGHVLDMSWNLRQPTNSNWFKISYILGLAPTFLQESN